LWFLNHKLKYKMIVITSKWIIIIFGIFIILVGMLMLFAPKKVNPILRKMASTNFINYTEITLRLVPALALILYADFAKYPEIFKAYGWIMLITTLVLFFIPRQIHHNFSLKIADNFKPLHFQIISLLAFFLGFFLIYCVL
jgi:uncharacterized membrane protein YfcA